jgi:hypothetical protein
VHTHSPHTRSFRLPRFTWLLPILGSLLLVACGGGHEIVYSCGGSATDAAVSYVGEGGETVEETVSIPWEQVIQRSGNDFSLRFDAENLGDSGDLACRVTIDGREMANTTWEETVSITVDYSKSGSSVEWSTSTSGTARENAPEPTPVAEEEAPANEEPGFTQADLASGLEVRNLNDSPVCEFYAVLTTQSSWGVNHLADQPPIETDASYVIPNFVEGSYNVKAVDCDGNIPAWYFNIDLKPGMWVSVNPVEENPPLTLVNSSSREICGFYIQHPAAGRLPNLFTEGSSVLPGSEMFIFVPQGLASLIVESCKGSEIAVLNTEAGSPPATWEITDDQFADAASQSGGEEIILSLQVINDSPNALCGVYITPPNQPWGANRLPAGTRLETGDTYLITNIVAQNYDLKIVTCEGGIPSFSTNTDYVSLVEQYGSALSYTVSGVLNTVVQNHSSVDLCGVTIAPTGTDRWFRNLLSDGESLHPGEEIALFVPGGGYDLQATACNGTTVVAPDQPIPDGYSFEVLD